MPRQARHWGRCLPESSMRRHRSCRLSCRSASGSWHYCSPAPWSNRRATSPPMPVTWSRPSALARYAFVENRQLRYTISAQLGTGDRLVLPGLADPALHAARGSAGDLVRPHLERGEPDRGLLFPDQPSRQRLSGGAVHGRAVSGPDRGRVFRAGGDRRVVGISVLLPADEPCGACGGR